MKLTKIARPARTSSSVNLPVRVKGYIEKDGAAGIVGSDVRTGKDVTIFLSTIGKAASNQKRLSVEALRDGFKVKRDQYKLEPGGLISCKGAFQPMERGGGADITTWINVLGDNTKEVDKYVGHSPTAMLRMFGQEGSARGTVYVYENDPAKYVRGMTAEDVREGLVDVAQNATRPGFMIRVLDHEGRVVDYAQKAKYYNQQENRHLDPDEIAGVIAREAGAMVRQHPGCSLDIVPIELISVSSKALITENGHSQLGAFQANASFFMIEQENGETDLVCKDVFMKFGGTSNEFINALFVTDPYGPGVDPVLLGQLEYSPQYEYAQDSSVAAPAQTTQATESDIEEATTADYDTSPGM